MITAKEFLKEQKIENNTIYNFEGEDVGYISTVMIRFAKLCCIEQAKVIYEKASATNKPKFIGDINCQIDEDSILNAYDLNNIK